MGHIKLFLNITEPDQNAEQHINIQIGNKSFEIVD